MDTVGGRGFGASPPVAQTADIAQPTPGILRSVAIKARLWRNRRIASPRFRAFVARFPLLRGIANRKAKQLFRLTSGFVHTQVLSACVQLGIFEALDGKALSTTAIATRCGMGPEATRALLDQARRLDLVISASPDLWMLSDAGSVVAADRGLREMIRHHDMLYRDLVDAGAFWRGDRGETELRQYWAYVRDNDPAKIGNDEAAPYSALMRESQAMLADCILASHDFGQYRSILDIGGGEGAFLSAVGERHPSVNLALFDLPAVTGLAARHMRERGMLTRCTLHPGDFTVDAIPAGHDCVTLVRILCDHDDDRVLAILRNIHRHLASGTRLVVAEAMAGDSEGANLAAIYFSTYFAAMGSGRCREGREIIDLLARSGFRDARMVPTTNALLAGLVIATR
ncbi:methyltransferase [Rhizobium wuzhouense]|uniref:Methyltransferase n=1 Tax=Rhizobium wuzhouense TaxID=1986026 RepID=A0ABX5NNW3_9HYPH|nr:methyltransferase [Rhizobium wuzhouense]